MNKLTSIIIPTRNNVDCLTLCLQSIRNLTSAPYEIIVVANKCTDNTKEIAKAYGAKVVTCDDADGFSTPCNRGVQAASGDFLLFLNDDTVVSKDWLTNLHKSYELLNSKSETGPVGAIGPVLNYVAGEQKYKGKIRPTFENRNEIAQEVSTKTNRLTGFLSGVCFLIKRDLFIEMGMWDEDLAFGGQDSALSLKLLLNGYKLAISNVYVHHFGSRTLSRPEFAKYNRGVTQLVDFCYKYHQPPATKLVATYLTHLDTFQDITCFKESLERTSQIVDEIYVLNVGEACVPLHKIQSKYSKIKICKQTSGENNLNHYNTLYKWCIENKADWVIALHHDELLEEKVTRDYVLRLTSPPVPEILQYWVHIYPFWGNKSYWRANGMLGRLTSIRISRVLPNYKVTHDDLSDMGLNPLPIFSSHNQAVSSIRVKNYKFVDIDHGLKRCNNLSSLVSDSIMNDGDLLTRKWIEKNGITITTIVKNERSFVVDYIKQIWGFADELVFVDTGSTDGTKQFLLFCGAKVIDYKWKDNYADARNVGLKSCTKEWILQLDFDESYTKIVDVRRMMEVQSADGYMFYISNLLPTGTFSISETVRLFRNHKGIEYSGYVHETTDFSFREYDLRIFRSPSEIVHYGFLKPSLRSKLKKYVKLNLMQMKDFPEDPRPYYNLGLHLIEDPIYEGKGLRYMLKACELDDRFFVPRKELGFYFLRKAIDYFQEAIDIIPDKSHKTAAYIREIISTITPFIENQQPLEKGHVREALTELKKEGWDV